VRLLRLRISEARPGRVLPLIALSHGAEEAARRYRALVLTTLRQLRGLPDAEIEITCEPEDAAEAIRFWILPALAERWSAQQDLLFIAEGWHIRFSSPAIQPEVIAEGEVLCPWLGARLVHTALLGLERNNHRVMGLSPCGRPYLQASGHATPAHVPVQDLPSMPIVHNHSDWLAALESPLGPMLKEHYGDGGL
jgi:hypothetical protein